MYDFALWQLPDTPGEKIEDEAAPAVANVNRCYVCQLLCRVITDVIMPKVTRTS